LLLLLKVRIFDGKLLVNVLKSRLVPEQAVPEKAAPKNAALEKVAPENAVLEKVAPEKAALEKAALEFVRSSRTARSLDQVGSELFLLPAGSCVQAYRPLLSS
jgi:hypothetical protein